MAESSDVLSMVLKRLSLNTSVAGAFDARGDYSVELGSFTGLKLHLLLKGDFWLSIDGIAKPIHVQAGDCFLQTDGRNAKVSTRPHAKKTVHRELLALTSIDGVLKLNGGGDVFGIGLHFEFDSHFAKVLFAHLPPLIFVPGHNDQAAALRWTIERFRSEYLGRSPGRSVFLEHLAPIILLQIFRTHAAAGSPERDWLSALSDKKLSKAIEAIHRDVRKAWSLDSLAKLAIMSRSSFASTFKKQVGLSPIEYLTHWRIHVACELLAEGAHDVAETADLVGYKSESAFSASFTKIMKCRPGRFAKQA